MMFSADLFTYYGYKFEAVCAGDEELVDSSSEFALVLKLRLGKHTLLMAAEVDCLNPEAAESDVSYERPLSAEQFLELKTIKLQPNKHLRAKSLAQKMPRWWVQSFLAGISTMVVSGRDDKGILQEASARLISASRLNL
ncbi:hypothetical protein CEUSTIGMA_g1669.t1 [Chlamydomonas eustigma]|uniref:Decapping nuclease n=1 Tax=Chlamydomonas eustigma TaxID=1157962 RepID=A0A250WUJ2_9CHLO|nr:hypothetical protein CEUSTIGMA_g1669.t1 [Chlamydomonas eustigma]|eukprot:GAX74220.1 hypothetical protein CEUSTIGMA_g1669.t1 [Chlamydomonas eustigma]